MPSANFDVVIARVSESAHKDSEVSLAAKSVVISENGDLTITTETGSQTFGATTWGAISVTRVASARERI
jgi:hypothetical protein